MIDSQKIDEIESDFNYVGLEFTKKNKKIKRRMYQRTYLNKLRVNILNKFDNKCSFCNSIHLLEFHHINPCKKGSSRGSYNRYNEVRQFPERFLLLCKDCHISMNNKE